MARLDRGPVSGAACGPDMPAIEVRSLSFAYPDADAAVLEGLDWSVSQGAFALLVGGHRRSAWAMCSRIPRTRLCARPCGMRWRLA